MAAEEDIGRAIIGSAIKVHSTVGPGLLESAYELCMMYELEKRGFRVQNQVALPLRYEDLTIEHAYRIDLLVNGLVVIELKAVVALVEVHRAQLLSYLRLGRYKLGYLLNFHVPLMRDGIVRLVNGL